MTKQLQAYRLALAEVGTREYPGSDHNPKVVQYFADVGHSWVEDDETAWCAAFLGSMLKRAGLPHTGKLTARSYLKWGEKVEPSDAREGDLLIFQRGNSTWQGHVGFMVEDKGTSYLVLGGNQSNHVNMKLYSKTSLLGIRRYRDVWQEAEDDWNTKKAEQPKPTVKPKETFFSRLRVEFLNWLLNHWR